VYFLPLEYTFPEVNQEGLRFYNKFLILSLVGLARFSLDILELPGKNKPVAPLSELLLGPQELSRCYCALTLRIFWLAKSQ